MICVIFKDIVLYTIYLFFSISNTCYTDELSIGSSQSKSRPSWGLCGHSQLCGQSWEVCVQTTFYSPHSFPIQRMSFYKDCKGYLEGNSITKVSPNMFFPILVYRGRYGREIAPTVGIMVFLDQLIGAPSSAMSFSSLWAQPWATQLPTLEVVKIWGVCLPSPCSVGNTEQNFCQFYPGCSAFPWAVGIQHPPENTAETQT